MNSEDYNNFLMTVKLNIQNGVYKLRTLDQTLQTVYHNFNCILDEKNQIISGLVSCHQCNMLVKFSGENYKENLQFHVNTCVPASLKKDIETKLSLGLYNIRLEIKRTGNLRSSLRSRLYARIIEGTGQAIEGFVYCIKCSKIMKSLVLKQHSCYDEAELYHIARRESHLRKSINNGNYELSEPSLGVQSLWRNFSFIISKRVIKGEQNIIKDYVYCRTCKWALYYPEEDDEELWLQRHHCNMPREELFQRSPHTSWQYLNYKNDLENKVRWGIYKLQRNSRIKPDIFKRFGFIVENDTWQRVKGMVCCYKCKKVKKYAESQDVYYLYQHQCARTSIIAEHKTEEPMFKTASELRTSKLVNRIQENIFKGIYRIERPSNKKSLMWKVFGTIKTEDDTTLDDFVCCLVCKSICVRSSDSLTHTCLAKYLENEREKGKDVQHDKQTSNIEHNLKCGNYKLKMVENRSSRIWKVFAIIIDGENKPIKNFLYCRKCTRALQVNGSRDGGGAKDNIAQHDCLLNYNENGSTENGGESGDGAKENIAQHVCRLNSEENVSRENGGESGNGAKENIAQHDCLLNSEDNVSTENGGESGDGAKDNNIAQHDCLLNSEENVSRENEVDTNRYKKCYKRRKNSSQSDARQEDDTHQRAQQDDANTSLDTKEQTVDDFVRKFKKWYEKKKRKQLNNSENETNAIYRSVESKEVEHGSDDNNRTLEVNIQEEHNSDVSRPHEVVKQVQGKREENSNRYKRCYERENNEKVDAIKRCKIKQEIIETETNEDLMEIEREENLNSIPDQEMRLRIKEEIEIQSNFEERSTAQDVAEKIEVNKTNETNTLVDMFGITNENNIARLQIKHENMEFVSIVEANEKNNRNLQLEDGIFTHKEMIMAVKDENIESETNLEANSSSRSFARKMIDQVVKDTQNKDKTVGEKEKKPQINHGRFGTKSTAKEPKREKTENANEDKNLNEKDATTSLQIKDEPLDLMNSNFEYVGRNEELTIVCCRHCQTLLEYNAENLQYHQCDKIENSNPQCQENNAEIFIIHELQETEGVQVKEEEDSEDAIEISDSDIDSNEEESCDNSQTRCYDQEMFSNNEEFDNNIITINDDDDDNDNAERDDDSTRESPLPKCIQDEYQLFVNEFKTVSYGNNKGKIEHEIHIDLESD
ncbi:uncharacterized protein isoform X2 [Musca autumnalis]|uniref:uncharacterized protein isoform X2 n=1 Tax=Musca autumnalis TaxID=221902 RepID=UPI003CEB8CBB